MRKISEIFINGVSLEDILEKHKRWLNNEGGKRADLMSVDLRSVDLSDVNLRSANLINADLTGADLTGADLSGSDLELANLSNAILIGAVLRSSNLNYSVLIKTDLTDADLTVAKLNGAILMNVKLNGANLNFTDLAGAKLSEADLENVKYNSKTSFFAMQCPEKGSFVGYKKADNKIVELLITEDSKRSSATTRKCRCSKAKVLNITNIENTEEYNEVVSNFDDNFIYKVGEIVEVKDFDDDRWNECSTGIHFFITRDEAAMY